MKSKRFPLKKADEPIESFIGTFKAELSVHMNVLSVPVHDAKEGYDFEGGLVDSVTKELILNGVHVRSGKVSQILSNRSKHQLSLEPGQHYIGSVLFGGILFDNFGHFLLESLARLWAYPLLKKYDPYLFFYVPWGEPKLKHKENYVRQVLDGFGIPVNRILFSNVYTAIDKVIIPSQKYGFGICRKPDNYILSFLNSFRMPVKRKKGKEADKVYVSRSKLSYSKGRPFGEAFFEKFLEKEGYMILYPEQVPLYEQVMYYRNADKIIFCDGGATYATILTPDLQAKIAIIARRRDYRWNYKEITEHFYGFGKGVTWIDEVEAQYEYGLETWDAAADINWSKAAIALKESDFVTNEFSGGYSQAYQAARREELIKFIKSIEHNPLFLDYMEKQKVQHPLLPSNL